MDPIRHQKVQNLRKQGVIPYAAKYERTHTLMQARDLKDGVKTSVAGRIVLLRDMGKVTFLTLQDHTGRMQGMLREEEIGAKIYGHFLESVDLGDFIGIDGERFTTQKNEPTVKASGWMMLSKALRQPPEKWHGIADQETAWRQRYLDLMSNRETFERFMVRSNFVKAMREFYWKSDFVEVDTPVLVNAASGALATPFKTHHEAYDIDIFLRIATETFLKECIVGGFDRVFEVGRIFRNEGLDPSHLQDFTMVEHYAAYWDYEKNMDFTEQMLATLLEKLTGSTKVKIPDRDGKLVTVDFAPGWPRLNIKDAIAAACGIDIHNDNSTGALREAIKRKNVRLEVPVENLAFGNLVDQLYKKVSRPGLVQPTFITRHPIELSPLARRNDTNPAITDRFQLVVGGWEIVNAYSELIDPVDQAERFEQQSKAQAGGDADAHGKDDEFVTALEYGCPPVSGWGMGVDRIVALLTQQSNLRDVVLFPLMKPVKYDAFCHPEPAKDDKMAMKHGSLRLGSGQAPAHHDKNSPSPSPKLALPLQHLTYGHLLPAAHGLIEKHADQTKAHLIATGVTMEALAKRFGGDPATWRVAGMLHDLDWDNLQKDFEKHCGTTLEHMLAEIGSPKELLQDIRAHYQEKYGAEHPLDSQLRKCLYCVDELTGFIIAVTLVRPSKKIADVEVSSVKKKLKDKGFAAQVSREQIKKCEELLGIPLDEMIGVTLEAMKTVAADLGL